MGRWDWGELDAVELPRTARLEPFRYHEPPQVVIGLADELAVLACEHPDPFG